MKIKNNILTVLILCLIFSLAIKEVMHSEETEVIEGVKIAFFSTHDFDNESFISENAEYGYVLNFLDERLSSETVSLAENSDFVCVFANDDVSSEVIEKLGDYDIKGIVIRGVGYDNIDIQKATELNIPVLNVPSYSPEAVAEHTAALLLSLTRKIPEAVSRTQSLNFDLYGLEGRNLNGLTAGIIGDGRIGKIVAQIFKGLGMRILVNGHHPNEEWASANGFEYVEKDTIYQECDVISLHCSLNESTYHLINEEALSQMKEDAILINTSRGALIDTEALIKALENNMIGGAALDVYENESPYFFRDCSSEKVEDKNLKKLLAFPNVIMTGHQAFLTDIALENIADTTLANIDAILNNQELDNKVNE